MKYFDKNFDNTKYIPTRNRFIAGLITKVLPEWESQKTFENSLTLELLNLYQLCSLMRKYELTFKNMHILIKNAKYAFLIFVNQLF